MAGKTKKALEAKKSAGAAAAAVKPEERKHAVDWGAVSAVLTGVLLFIVLCFSSASTVKGSAVFCVVLMLAVGAIRYKTLRDWIWIPLISLSLYVLMDGISTFYAVSGKFALSEFLKVLIAFCTSVTLLSLSPGEEKIRGRWMATVLAVCCALANLINVDMYSDGALSRGALSVLGRFTVDYTGLTGFLNDTSNSSVGDRFAGIFNNHNIQAGFSALGVLLSMGLAHVSRSYTDRRGFWRHGGYLLLLAVNVLGLLLPISLGATAFLILGMGAFLLFEHRESRGPLLMLMIETVAVAAVDALVCFSAVGRTAPVSLLCVAGSALVLILLDRFAGAKIGELLNRYVFAVPVLAGIAVVFAIVAFLWTGPMDLGPGEAVSRGVRLEPGVYTLTAETDGAASLTITSQMQKNGYIAGSQTLYSGDLTEDGISFEVPEDSLVIYFRFSTEEGAGIVSVKCVGDGKTVRVPLDYYLLPEVFANRMQGLLASSSFRARLMHYRDGLALFRLNPLFGRGMGSFENGLKSVQTRYYETKYAHNHYIQAMTDTGVVGLILFLTLMISSCTVVILQRKKERLAILSVTPMSDGADEGQTEDKTKSKTSDPGSLTAMLGASVIFMASNALTDVGFSAYPYLIIAFGIFAIINLCCGHRVSWPQRTVQTVTTASIGVLTGLFTVFLLMNLYAGYYVDREQSLESLVKAAEIDKFEWADYKYSYLLFAMENQDLPAAIVQQADAYAEDLEDYESNTTGISVAQYYFQEGRNDKAFAMLRKYVDYLSSDSSAWQNSFRLLMAYETNDEGYRMGVQSIIERMDRWNENNIGTISLDEETGAFVDRMRNA